MSPILEPSNGNIPQLNLPWVDSPFFEQLLAQSGLDETTRQQVQQFAQDGYLIIDPELDDFEALAAQTIADLKQLEENHPADSGVVVSSDRIQNAWRMSSAVKTIATAPKILSLLKILYQRDPIPFHTLNFSKGTEQATHSDIVHFSCFPSGFMCGVWVALEDIDAENGPLHYYPGSQKLPIYNLNDLGFSCSYEGRPYKYYLHYLHLIQQLIDNLNLKKVDLAIKTGQALIWSANLLHGGSPILDPNRTRYSQVTHYYFDRCTYYTPLLSDPGIGRIYTNAIVNLITGEMVPHCYNGTEIQVYPENYAVDQLQNQVSQMQTQIEQLHDQLKQQTPLQALSHPNQTKQSDTNLHKNRYLETLWLKLRMLFGDQKV